MSYREPDLSNVLEDVSEEGCVFSVEEEAMASSIDLAGVEIGIDESRDDFANDNANEMEHVNIQSQNREKGDIEDPNRTQLVNEVYQEDTAEECLGETVIGIDDSHNNAVNRTPVHFENESEFVIEESESKVVVEEVEVVIDESGLAINKSELAVVGSLSYADEYNPDEDSPDLIIDESTSQNGTVSNADEDKLTSLITKVSAAAAKTSDMTGSSCGTSATAIVFEDISDDETEQTETAGFGGTGTTHVAIEYEDITDDENDPPKTFHYYCAKNVGVGAGATKDIFAEVQDFSKRSYKQLPISLLTPKLAPTCPKELERSFQEAQIFTIGELSDCTAPEIEVHFRIQNPAHISKYQMTQIALADFWAQFLKAEEAQMKKADRLEKEQTETQESGCGPGPSTSTGEGWFMPLDELSINLLRLPVDQATAILDAARSNGTKLSE